MVKDKDNIIDNGNELSSIVDLTQSIDTDIILDEAHRQASKVPYTTPKQHDTKVKQIYSSLLGKEITKLSKASGIEAKKIEANIKLTQKKAEEQEKRQTISAIAYNKERLQTQKADNIKAKQDRAKANKLEVQQASARSNEALAIKKGALKKEEITQKQVYTELNLGRKQADKLQQLNISHSNKLALQEKKAGQQLMNKLIGGGGGGLGSGGLGGVGGIGGHRGNVPGKPSMIPRSARFLRTIQQRGTQTGYALSLMTGGTQMMKGIIGQAIMQKLAPRYEEWEDLREEKAFNLRTELAKAEGEAGEPVTTLRDELRALVFRKAQGDATVTDELLASKKDVIIREAGKQLQTVTELRAKYKKDIDALYDDNNIKNLEKEFIKSSRFRRFFSIGAIMRLGLTVGGVFLAGRLLGGAAMSAERSSARKAVFSSNLEAMFSNQKVAKLQANKLRYMRELGLPADVVENLIKNSLIFQQNNANDVIKLAEAIGLGLKGGVAIDDFIANTNVSGRRNIETPGKMVKYLSSLGATNNQYVQAGSALNTDDVMRIILGSLKKDAVGRYALQRKTKQVTNELNTAFKTLVHTIGDMLLPLLLGLADRLKKLLVFMNDFIENPFKAINKLRARDTIPAVTGVATTSKYAKTTSPKSILITGGSGSMKAGIKGGLYGITGNYLMGKVIEATTPEDSISRKFSMHLRDDAMLAGAATVATSASTLGGGTPMAIPYFLTALASAVIQTALDEIQEAFKLGASSEKAVKLHLIINDVDHGIIRATDSQAIRIK